MYQEKYKNPFKVQQPQLRNQNGLPGTAGKPADSLNMTAGLSSAPKQPAMPVYRPAGNLSNNGLSGGSTGYSRPYSGGGINLSSSLGDGAFGDPNSASTKAFQNQVASSRPTIQNYQAAAKKLSQPTGTTYQPMTEYYRQLVTQKPKYTPTTEKYLDVYKQVLASPSAPRASAPASYQPETQMYMDIAASPKMSTQTAPRFGANTATPASSTPAYNSITDWGNNYYGMGVGIEDIDPESLSAAELEAYNKNIALWANYQDYLGAYQRQQEALENEKNSQAQQAYIQREQAEKNLPQQLKAQGLYGLGASETSNIAMLNAYRNAIGKIAAETDNQKSSLFNNYSQGLNDYRTQSDDIFQTYREAAKNWSYNTAMDKISDMMEAALKNTIDGKLTYADRQAMVEYLDSMKKELRPEDYRSIMNKISPETGWETEEESNKRVSEEQRKAGSGILSLDGGLWWGSIGATYTNPLTGKKYKMGWGSLKSGESLGLESRGSTNTLYEGNDGNNYIWIDYGLQKGYAKITEK